MHTLQSAATCLKMADAPLCSLLQFVLNTGKWTDTSLQDSRHNATNGNDKSPASMCSCNFVLACSNAARAGVFAVQPCRASIMSLLVGSALHSHCRASAIVSLTVGILLSRRGVIMLRTTCITLHSHQHPDAHMACWVLQTGACL